MVRGRLPGSRRVSAAEITARSIGICEHTVGGLWPAHGYAVNAFRVGRTVERSDVIRCFTDGSSRRQPIRAAIVAQWHSSPHSVLLATGEVFDVVDVPAHIGTAAGDRIRGPVAVTPFGRWMFLVRAGRRPVPGVGPPAQRGAARKWVMDSGTAGAHARGAGAMGRRSARHGLAAARSWLGAIRIGRDAVSMGRSRVDSRSSCMSIIIPPYGPIPP